MNFLVSIETPGQGSYVLGYVRANTRETAQDDVFEKLVSAGLPAHKIGKQVSDKSTLHIGLHTISITPLKEFDTKIAQATTTLL